MLEKLERQVDLIGRHYEVFRMVIEAGPIGIVKLSERTGHAHHEVRYSLRVLEEEGLIDPTEEGAVTTDAARDFLSTHGDRIDDLIERLQATRSDVAAQEM